MYDEHDQGVQGSLGKLRNLPICTIVAKSQKDCPVRKTKFGQKEMLHKLWQYPLASGEGRLMEGNTILHHQ